MESGNEYVIQVKGNQKNLLNAIKQTVDENSPRDTDSTNEKNKGRTEQREVNVYTNLDHPIFKEWAGIREVVHVISTGKRNKIQYQEDRYYISSIKYPNAKLLNSGIRSHWGIENKLHWVKDVILNEDKSMVLDLDRSGNMSLIRNIVINLYRISGYTSIKYAIEAFTNNIEKCCDLILQKNVYD